MAGVSGTAAVRWAMPEPGSCATSDDLRVLVRGISEVGEQALQIDRAQFQPGIAGLSAMHVVDLARDHRGFCWPQLPLAQPGEATEVHEVVDRFGPTGD